jgi:translation initiation factor IF-1
MARSCNPLTGHISVADAILQFRRTKKIMGSEKIKVRLENGKTMDVVVSNKRADAIWIVLGEGLHSSKCKLAPTRNELAYVGQIMGREILYERSVQQVREDIDKHNLSISRFNKAVKR